jgi:streptogramin lyase
MKLRYLAFVCFFTASSLSHAQSISYVDSFGSYGNLAGQFDQPWGIDVDASGDVYVADWLNKRIQKFDSDGNFKGMLAASNLVNIHGIAIAPSGRVFTSQSYDIRIKEFSSELQYLTGFGTRGSGIGQFKSPWGLTVSNSGDIYVADTGNNRVQKFTSSGQHIQTIGSLGSSDGFMDSPYDVATDVSGNLYVADYSNARVQIFDGQGNHKLSFGSIGQAEGKFYALSGIVVNSAGIIFTAEILGSRVQAFRPDGTFITTFGTYGEGIGQFRQPLGITITDSDRIYVTDEELGRVQILQFHPAAPEPPILNSAVTSIGEITLNYSAPDFNGGAIVTGYTASCNGQTKNTTSSSVVFSGLTNGTEYACSVTATNAAGKSVASNTINATPVGPPEAPVITSVESGDGELLVRFYVANNGGSEVTGYEVNCGTESATGFRSPIVVTSLNNDAEYSCSVVATNEAGTSASSSSVSGKPEPLPTGLPIWLLYEATK